MKWKKKKNRCKYNVVCDLEETCVIPVITYGISNTSKQWKRSKHQSKSQN